MRRTRLLGAQRELWPNWRYHCFVTDRADLDTCAADAYPPSPRHRGARHSRPQRELRAQPLPSGRFPANGAWLACCVLAHNLARWTARLGRAHPTRQLTVAATIRNRLLTVPGRLVNHSGRHRLRLPLNWPWANTFTTACNTSATCPSSSDPPLSAPRSAAEPHPPPTAPAPHSSPARPKRAGPHTRTSPAATRPQTVDPTNPSVDSG